MDKYVGHTRHIGQMETSRNQAEVVDQEKRAIYEPFTINDIFVFGSLVGTMELLESSQWHLKNFEHLNLPASMIQDILIAAIRRGLELFTTISTSPHEKHPSLCRFLGHPSLPLLIF
uniref:Uncharacterized protein n=1 Tax=Cacopsylla melanoneura TaxID=428564 RepID=A0A8D8TQD0_9HEMI